MTRDEALKAADRAATAAGAAKREPGAWLRDAGMRADLDAAAHQVRCFPDASAEALFLTLVREPLAWRDLEARKRVAIEVFRATLLICDRLAAADAPPPGRAIRGEVIDPDDALDATVPGLTDRW